MKHGKKLLSVMLALVMVLALLPSAAFAAEGEKHITILGTSDMHGNIWGFSYEDSKETDNNGMARLYTYIQQVRAENPNTILIDAGDDIQGTIMTDDIYNKIPEEPHPVVAAMNYMGYDAMTLGNHEFNWGIDTMQKILSQAQFPVLAANVKDASGGFVTGAGWTIVEKDGVKVAVIGGVRNGGRDIARFDLTLDQNNHVTDATVEIVDMTGVTPSQDLRDIELVKESHQKTIDFITGGGSGEDGEGGAALGSTTAKFQPVDEIAGLPEGKLQDTAVMDLINKVQLENSGADVSAAALFKDTSDLPEGDINYGNIFDIYKFDNTLYRVTVTGKELKGYMEWAAACYNQWVPGDINISFDPEYPGYLYDMFAGVDYEIDLSQPKGERIKNVMFKGAPLQDDQTLTLAVNNYRYSSALKAQNLIAGKKEWESSNSIRDMIVAYLAEHSPISPEVDNNWKIVGVDLSLDDPRRQEIIDLVNAGRLDTPYDKSYNLADYDAIIASAAPAGNVAVNGTVVGSAFTYQIDDGAVYYRLRDLAFALKDTSAAFNVEWNGQMVVITKGAAYTAEPIQDSPMSPAFMETTLSVLADGQVEVAAALMSPGYHCVTAEGLAALLGLSVTEADGVLTITTA